MSSVFTRLILVIFFWGSFIFVILKVPYPESLSQANIIQILSFFVPLYLALVFSVYIFLRNIFICASISLGLIFLLILKALDSLNLVTIILTAIAIYLLASYFRKGKRSSLTKWSKIPKLTRLRK